jgi:hypothetical protein
MAVFSDATALDDNFARKSLGTQITVGILVLSCGADKVLNKK